MVHRWEEKPDYPTFQRWVLTRLTLYLVPTKIAVQAHTHTHTHTAGASGTEWSSYSVFPPSLRLFCNSLNTWNILQNKIFLYYLIFFTMWSLKRNKIWFKIEVLVFSTWSKLEPSFISSYEFSLRSVPDGGISQPLRRRKRSTKPSCSTVLSLQHDSIFLSEMTCLYCV